MRSLRISSRLRAATLAMSSLLAAVATPVVLTGCKRAPAPATAPAIRADARLTAWTGTVEIERAGKILPAAKDAPLLVGDLVRTGADARAHLGFDNGQTVHLGERALLRLGRDAASSLELTVIVGQAHVEGGALGAVTGDRPRALQIVTPGGPVRLTPGGRLRVKALSDRTHYELMVGQASLTGADAGIVTLTPGDGLSIAIGGSVLERYHIQLGPTEVERIEAVDPDKAAASDDEPSPSMALGPGSAGTDVAAPRSNGIDVTLTAGETATVHSEGRSAALVRFRLPPDCPAPTAVLRGLPRDTRKSVNAPNDDAGFVSARLAPGYFAYRLICAGKQRARGTLTIRADTGLATLPRRPPRNRLDADGRRYTVLFQNLLPTFELSWPHAPSSAAYVLHVQTRGRAHGSHTWPSSTPALELRPGAVPEGEHTWWWSTPDGRRSATTSLTLKFDNAALTAEIQAPRPQQAGLPDPISGSVPAALEVAGTTLPGSRVTVDDLGLPLDAQGRFRAEIPLPPADRRALAIRIEHRRTGVHYYLRRLAGR
jgi:hypothetical protein